MYDELDEILEATEVVEEVKVVKKETKKKHKVVLVTATAIYFEDKGFMTFVDKKGFEDVKKGDMIKI